MSVYKVWQGGFRPKLCVAKDRHAWWGGGSRGAEPPWWWAAASAAAEPAAELARRANGFLRANDCLTQVTWADVRAATGTYIFGDTGVPSPPASLPAAVW